LYIKTIEDATVAKSSVPSPGKKVTIVTPAHSTTNVSATTKPAEAVSENHNTSNKDNNNNNQKHKLKMDESAHTFGANNAHTASVSSHYRGRSPVMITDALSDVRLNYHIDMKELGHGHYGVVRKCYHRETGAAYAVKVRVSSV
jgi:calcium-dependent protein kinase